MDNETGISGAQCGNDYDEDDIESQEWLNKSDTINLPSYILCNDGVLRKVGQVASEIATPKPEVTRTVGEVWR